MLAPVLSANETPAAEASAARAVVATEATTAAATPCFQAGCRAVAWVVALGVEWVWTWVADMSCSVSSASRPVRPAHPLHERPRPDPTGREEKSSPGRFGRN